MKDHKLNNKLGKLFDMPLDLDVEIGGAFIEKSGKPIRVPKALGITPDEFMDESIDKFKSLCESLGYRKVISSIQYVQNFASDNNNVVIDRSKELKKVLKEWYKGTKKDDNKDKEDKNNS